MKKISLSICFFLLFVTNVFSQNKHSFGPNPASASSLSFYNNGNLSRSNAFVENKGQFIEIPESQNKGILYQLEDNNMQVSFTNKGLTYILSTREKVSEKEWEEFIEKNPTAIPEEEEREKREHTNEHYIPKFAVVDMTWDGSNPNIEIISENPTENYFNYYNPIINKDKIIGNVKGFKKITYKNVYPFIDIEYTLHPTEGIKYSYILHPGANPSMIKMSYAGAKIKLDAANNLKFVTEGGIMTDYAPLTYSGLESAGKIIESEFELDKNTIGFKLKGISGTVTETIVIDPWQKGPSFPANGYTPNDLSVDGAGNVLVYSYKPPPFLGTSTQRADKYNAAGVLQWTLNLSTNLGYTNAQGDIAADPAGNMYLCIGLGPNNNSAFYNTVKIDPTGTLLMWGSFSAGTGANNMMETWTITFNCDYTQFYQSGGGRVVAGTSYFNMSVEEPVNAATGTEGVLIENDSMGDIYCTYYAPNSLVYHMTTDSNQTPNLAGGQLPATTGTKNNLVCFNPSSGARLFRVQLGNGYNYEDGDFKAPGSVGMNAMVSSCQFLYTMNGNLLDRWNPLTGAHYNQVAIPGGIGGHANSLAGTAINSGILTDKCGNVYVGSNGAIYVFDPALNLINTIAGLPGRVFDIAWKSSANTEMYVCGGTTNATTFLADISIPACTLPNQVSITPAQPTCATPLGSASALATFCGAPYTYSWSDGQITQTATNLPPGNYTVTVSSSISCPYSYVETQTVTINSPVGGPSATIAATSVTCVGASTGSATVTASGGAGSYTYTWTPVGGNGATASGLPAGSYTVNITDGSGCTTSTVVALSAPPALNVSPTSAPTSCGLNNGTASANASGGTGAITYTWTPSGGNGSTASGLGAGTYNCSVTDANGCTNSGSTTIAASSNPSASISSSATVTCFGGSNGSATANASGGSGGYTYTWTPSGGNGATASGLPAGSYTCNITDASGCTTSTSIVIGQPGSGVSASISASASVTCNGASTGSATANASGGTAGYTYTWTPIGGNSSSASGLPAGSYTCTITDASGCVTSTSTTLTEPVSPVSAATSFTAASCGQNNGAASVSVSGGTAGYTYTWTPIGGNGATASNIPSGNYNCGVTDANGCTANFPITVSNSSGPSLNVSASSSVTCNGANDGSATVNATGGAGSYTYTWTPIGGNAASATNLPPNTYTCSVTDGSGCLTTTVITIGGPSAIVVTPSFTPAVCGQNNGAASVSVSGGTAGYTYSWTPSGGNAATESGIGSGNYNCTITDANGCTQLVSITVTNSGGPTASIASTGTVNCFGASTGSATASASGGTGTYSYTWTPVGGNAATASNIPAGTYTCTIADGNNCLATTVVTIAEPASALAASATASSASCNGASTGSATVAASGGTSAYTYTWVPIGGNATTASGLPANTYTCNITDANGCTTNTIVTVSEPAVLALGVSATTSITCNGGTNGVATVSVAGGTAGYTYTWVPSGGNAATASGLSSGTYTCNSTDANGCTTFTTVTINQPNAPIAVTVNPTNISCNGNTNGSATATVVGGTSAYTYTWVPSGGNTATASGLGAGTYTCNITDANGCTGTNSAIIIQPPVLTLNIAPTNVKCNGGSNGSAIANAGGGTGTITYSWTPTGGNAATASNLGVGTYTCTITDANGCTTNSVSIITQPLPLTITPSVTPVGCSGANNGTASITVVGGTGPYTVSWNTTPVQTGTTAIGLGAGSYIATVIDANNCSNPQSVIITSGPPIDTLTISGTLCSNDPTVVLSAPSGGITPNTIGAPYQWYTGASVITGATSNAYTGVQANVNTYWVSWYLHGCKYITTTVIETLYQDISHLPQTNIFTPNADKVNDEFLPLSIENSGTTITYQQIADAVQDYNLYIYDRWGSLVFHATQPLDTWTGFEINGKEANPGTYFWIAKYKTKCNTSNSEQTIKGFVQLIR